MTTCFRVVDMNGLPARDIPITASWSGKTVQARTNSAGIVRFVEDIPLDAKIYGIGFSVQTRIVCDEPIIPPPPPPGEAVVGSVGTSCDIMQKYMFGSAWYRYRNRYTGSGSSWDSEIGDAEDLANDTPGCFAPPPPPPKTVDDVQKDVDILRGTLQEISSAVQDLVTSITETGKAIVDVEMRVKVWISEVVFELLMKNLNASAIEFKKLRGKT